MLNKVLGIVNFDPNYVHIDGMDDFRSVSSTSILGRYRVIDFSLSNFVNSGIYNVEVLLKSRPRALIEHISETNYGFNKKRGKIHLLPSENTNPNNIYNTDLKSMMSHIQFFEENNAAYVIIAPSHFVYIQDFKKMLEHHIESKNDITMLYQIVNNADKNFVMCDSIELDDKQNVISINQNLGNKKRQLISLETYVMSKKLFLDLIYAGLNLSSVYTFRDAIKDAIYDRFSTYKVGGYVHAASAYCISSLMSYYNSVMHIRKENEVNALLTDKWPIHTRTNDSCPTLYCDEANVKGSIISNGCIIEGTVINSVIGRNVVIKKGSVIKDSIILPNVLINKNVILDKCVVDRYAIITHVKDLKGEENMPLYIARRDRI